MSFEAICKRLPEREVAVLTAVRASAERLLNHTPRFRIFTFHGTEHLNTLFEIFEILLEGRVELSSDEIFLLALAICIHDLGMVVTLRDKDLAEILEGKPAFPDPASFELRSGKSPRSRGGILEPTLRFSRRSRIVTHAGDSDCRHLALSPKD